MRTWTCSGGHCPAWSSPLDVAAELHTRADRVSVEFRRVLAAAVSD